MKKKNIAIATLALLLLISVCVGGLYTSKYNNVSQTLAWQVLDADLMKYSRTEDAYIDDDVNIRESHSRFIYVRSTMTLNSIKAYYSCNSKKLNIETIVSDCQALAEQILYGKDEKVDKNKAWELLKEVTKVLDCYSVYDEETPDNSNYVKQLKKCDAEAKRVMEQIDYPTLHNEVEQLYNDKANGGVSE